MRESGLRGVHVVHEQAADEADGAPGERLRMTYQKALLALEEYIAKFDPAEFSSSPDFEPASHLTAEQKAKVDRLRTRIKRKRLLSESMNALFGPNGPGETEVIITQDQVDALLEGWKGPTS